MHFGYDIESLDLNTSPLVIAQIRWVPSSYLLYFWSSPGQGQVKDPVKDPVKYGALYLDGKVGGR